MATTCRLAASATDDGIPRSLRLLLFGLLLAMCSLAQGADCPSDAPSSAETLGADDRQATSPGLLTEMAGRLGASGPALQGAEGSDHDPPSQAPVRRLDSHLIAAVAQPVSPNTGAATTPNPLRDTPLAPRAPPTPFTASQ